MSDKRAVHVLLRRVYSWACPQCFVFQEFEGQLEGRVQCHKCYGTFLVAQSSTL